MSKLIINPKAMIQVSLNIKNQSLKEHQLKPLKKMGL